MDGKGKGKVTEDRKWKRKSKEKAMEEGKRKRKGNNEGKGIVKQTPGGGDMSHSVA